MSAQTARSAVAERLAVGAVVVATSLAAVVTVVRGWVPLSDDALIELRVRDVPGHLPLIGVWSRFGWSHPGPSQFYYLSVFYWLGGRSSTMLLVASLFLHLAFLLVSWWIVRRLDPLMGSLVLLGGVALMATSSPVSLRSPWNPYVVIIGGLALCCAAWSCAERRTPGVILLPVIASFLVQAHLPTAPLVLAVSLTAVVLLVCNREREVPLRALAVGAVLTVIMWVPPLIQQVFDNPGNLSAIVTQQLSSSNDNLTGIVAGDTSGRMLGVIPGLKVASDALQPWPGSLNHSTVDFPMLQVEHWRFPFWGLLFVAAFIYVVRSRNSLMIRAATIAAAAFVGSLLGVVTLRGAEFSYLALSVRSSSVMIIVVVVGVGIQWLMKGSAGTELPRRLPGRVGAHVERWSVAVIAALTVVLTVIFAVVQVAGDNPLSGGGAMIKEFTRSVESQDLPRRIEVQSLEPNVATMAAAPGLLLSLERAGYRVSAPTLGAGLVGKWRAEAPAHYVVKIIPPELSESFMAQGWDVLDSYDPFTAGEAAELKVRQERFDKVRSVPGQSNTKIVEALNSVRSLQRERDALVLVGRPER